MSEKNSHIPQSGNEEILTDVENLKEQTAGAKYSQDMIERIHVKGAEFNPDKLHRTIIIHPELRSVLEKQYRLTEELDHFKSMESTASDPENLKWIHAKISTIREELKQLYERNNNV